MRCDSKLIKCCRTQPIRTVHTRDTSNLNKLVESHTEPHMYHVCVRESVLYISGISVRLLCVNVFSYLEKGSHYNDLHDVSLQWRTWASIEVVDM